MAINAGRPRARVRRFALIAGVLVAAFTAGMLGAGVLSSALSASTSHKVGWMLAVGIGGPRFDPAVAQTTRVVNVEVQWPSCVEPGDDSWLKSDVSYTPWSVTITLSTTDAYARNEKCHPVNPGTRPMVGYYLSALSYPVQLTEPLAGRELSDGSKFPAAARPYH